MVEEPQAEACYTGNQLAGALAPAPMTPEQYAAQEKRWAEEQARRDAQQALEGVQRLRAAALEAALRCNAGATDWQLVLKAARDFRAFLENG